MRTRPDHRRGSRRDGFVRTAAAAMLAIGPAIGFPAMGEDTPGAKSLEDYRLQGLRAAMQTKGALGSELMKAVEAGGPAGAVAFCNTRALPITQDMSEKLGVDVSRVSDQPRNPANAANDEELAIIASFKESLARGQPPAPAVREHDETVVGYYPIVTNAMCLKCHGAEGSDISPATQAAIDERYPADQATGYGENALRGLFVVKMDRAQSGAARDGAGSEGNE